MHETREAWYLAAAKRIEQRVFKPAGYELSRFRIGCGWPISSKAKTGAECFGRERSDDKTCEIFISPYFVEPSHVLAMIVHELCHTIVGLQARHRKPFIKVMRDVGMAQPWIRSVAGEALRITLASIQEKLGPYPHAKLGLKPKGEKKQTTRLLKLTCPKCGYTARITRKWLDEAGAPLCPTHNVAFIEEVKKELEVCLNA